MLSILPLPQHNEPVEGEEFLRKEAEEKVDKAERDRRGFGSRRAHLWERLFGRKNRR